MAIDRESIINGCFVFWGAVTCPVWFGPLLCYVAYENDDSDDNDLKPKISQNFRQPQIKQIACNQTHKSLPLPGNNLQDISTSQPRNHLSCPICYHSDKNLKIMNPCGHAICYDCSTIMNFKRMDNCPVCRSKIISLIKLYL